MVGDHRVARAEPASAGDIQVIARVAKILSLFTTTRSAVRTAEVAADLDLQRPTAHRYLISMANARLLERQDDGTMALGPLLVKVGALALGTRQVVRLARPFMQRLAAETHQTAILSLWGGHGPVVAMIEEDRTREVRITVQVGYALRLDSAQSAVFLAHLPDPVLAARLVGALPAHLATQIQAQVKRVLDDRLAVFTAEVEGLRAVAAPIFDKDGICAALALLGTTAGIPADPGSVLADALRGTADQLSGDLQSAGHPMAEEDPADAGGGGGLEPR